MLPIVTGIVASSLNVLAIPHHLHALAPRGLSLPVRAGTTGGYWGVTHGAAVMLLGLVGLSVRRLADIQVPLVWVLRLTTITTRVSVAARIIGLVVWWPL